MRNEPPAPITLKPDHAKLSAYFNLDNGTGKIRGIYLQENAAMKPVFEALDGVGEGPRRDRASRCATPAAPTTSRSTASGCPGFQFIQDPIEYWTAPSSARTTPTWTSTTGCSGRT